MCVHTKTKESQKIRRKRGRVKNETKQVDFFNTFPCGYAPEAAQSAQPVLTAGPDQTEKFLPSPHYYRSSSVFPSNHSSYSSNYSTSSATNPLSSSPAYIAGGENLESPFLALQQRQQARLSRVRRYYLGAARGFFFDACDGGGVR